MEEKEKGWGRDLGSDLITIFGTGFNISQATSMQKCLISWQNTFKKILKIEYLSLFLLIYTSVFTE